MDIRTKGQTGEREFLQKLSDLLGLEEKLTRNLDQTRCGGADCVQLQGYAIEIKNQRTVTLPEWWRQAVKQAKTLKSIPLLAYKVPRKGWLVVVPCPWVTTVVCGTSDIVVDQTYVELFPDTVQMSLEFFVELYKRYHGSVSQ